MQHDSVTVHVFIGVVMNYIKQSYPHIKAIKYFSDGAASQYKNFKNFANLLHHQEDFGLAAEWHFFATSHGKSPCDGIGGTVKRLVARSSLQATNSNHILTAEQLFEWATVNITGIKFFFVPNSDIQLKTPQQEIRFTNAKKVPGTRNNHCFIPDNNKQLKMFRISSDTAGILTNVTQDIETPLDVSSLYMSGKYVAAVYDQAWYAGNIVQFEQQSLDVLVNFMTSSKTHGAFQWPRKRDECWVPTEHILCFFTCAVNNINWATVSF